MKKIFLVLSLFFTAPLAMGGALEDIDQALNAGDFGKARKELESRLAKDSRDFGALWRLSRLEVLDADAKTNSAEKEKGYEKALELANAAVEVSPSEPHGYLRRASAAGKIALYKGVLEAREKVLLVRASAERAISIATGGPEVQAWAHYVLGRSHLKLSDTPAVIRKPLGLAWGSISEAEKHLMTAVQLKPGSALIWTEVAKLRKKQKNRAAFDEAIAKVNGLAIREVTDREGKAEAAQLKYD